VAAPYPAAVAPAMYPTVAAGPAALAAPAAGFYPAPIAEHHHHYEPAAEPTAAAQKEKKSDTKEEAGSEKPTVVIEKEVVPVKETREATPVPENETPNSSVLRAIAAANE